VPRVTFIEADGREFEVDITIGSTVMQGAVDNAISGILAECGGSCSCSTCHCYVDVAWTSKIPKASGIEKDMLTAVMDLRSGSRLSCQIQVTDDMDGLIVRLPESQY
jgi:ferredoxin, 2Fe-2S